MRTLRRTAYGATAPSSITGTATSTSTAISEPTNAPASTRSSASTETRRNGPATKGTIASRPAAHEHDPAEPGERRVAVGEPPADPVAALSATSTVAIVFAQTIVDAPNHGASSRAAAISAPSDAAPTTAARSSMRRAGTPYTLARFVRERG